MLQIFIAEVVAAGHGGEPDVRPADAASHFIVAPHELRRRGRQPRTPYDSDGFSAAVRAARTSPVATPSTPAEAPRAHDLIAPVNRLRYCAWADGHAWTERRSGDQALVN